MRYRHNALLSVIALAGFAATAQVAVPAHASTAPLSDAREVAHFDVNVMQQPENITLEPGGAADVTFNRARQVARVGTDGSVSILATLPAPATGAATVSGIVRGKDGSLYVNYNAGSQSGIWRIARGGGTPVQVVALPDSKSPGFGANGIKVHDGAVWVSNTDHGTLLRIPIDAHGAAGAVTTVAQGLTAIDDFAFTGDDDTLVAAQNYVSEVSLVHPDGTHQTVLTSTDGLSNPTSIAVRGSTVYVASGAYFTHVDPNLLLAKLG